MTSAEIEKLIKNLEREITTTQQGDDLEASLARLRAIAKAYTGEDEVVSFADIVSALKAEPAELKIFSGWKSLDAILDGFRLQQVVVVSALTKSGKTSFVMDLTTRVQEHRPLWFPFEESAEELMRKFLDRGEEPPHGYTPKRMRGDTLAWIEAKVVEAIAKHGSKIIFIDHLDYIVPFRGDNHALAIADTLREVKSLAKKWNVVIFLICHLSQANMDTQPTMRDLRGSSAIGQEADTVILLWRETKREHGEVVITDNVNVSVQANRRTGRTGNVKMIYSRGKFLEQDWSDFAESAETQGNDFDQYGF